MLLAAVTVWIRDPWTNLVVQTAINTACAFGTLYLTARWLHPPSRAWCIFGTAGLFLCCLPSDWIFDYWLIQQPYAVSLCLAMGALLLWRRTATPSSFSFYRALITEPRLWLCTVLLGMAFWVNLALAPLILFLIVATIALKPQAKPISLLLSWALAFTVGYLLMRFGSHPLSTVSQIVGPQEAWTCLRKLIRHLGKDMAEGPIWGGCATIIGCLALVAMVAEFIPKLRSRPSQSPLLVILPALGFVLFVSFLYWPAINGFNTRYITPSLVFLTVAAASAAVRLLPPRRRRIFVPVCLLATLGVVVARFEPHTPTGARGIFDQHWGKKTALLSEWKPTFIAGEYWKAWPTYFHVRAEHYRTGRAWTCYALSDRSIGTAEFWLPYLDDPETTVAVWTGDPVGKAHLDTHFGSDWEAFAFRDGMELYRRKQPPAGSVPRPVE